MGGQRPAVGLAGALALGFGRCDVTCGMLTAQCRLDIFEGELELIGIELLGLAAKAMPLEGLEDRLQPFDPGIGLALGIAQIGQCSLQMMPGASALQATTSAACNTISGI